MRVNTYRLLTECIERGLEYGFTRAHKHTDTPTREHILEQQDIAIMGEICEYFEFSDPDRDCFTTPDGACVSPKPCMHGDPYGQPSSQGDGDPGDCDGR